MFNEEMTRGKYNTKKQQEIKQQEMQKNAGLIIEMECIMLNQVIIERELKYFTHNGLNYKVWLNVLKETNKHDIFEYHVKRKDPLTLTLIEDFYYYPEGHNSCNGKDCRITGFRQYKQKLL